MNLPAGPRAPGLLQTLRWAFDPIGFMESCARRYGDMFTVNLGPIGPMVMITDPELIRGVFGGDARTWHTATDSSTVADVVGPSSVLVLQEDAHLRQRRLLLPPFHGERMRAYGDVIAGIAREEIARWPRYQPFALHPHMQSITLDVILRAVFGLEDGRRQEELRGLLIEFLRTSQSARTQVPLLRTLSGDVQRLTGRMEAINAVLFREIAERRARRDTAERSDILSLLLQAEDDNGEGMSDAELRDELITLLLAGHETTATSLAWAFERLLRNPDAMQRLHLELDSGDAGDYLDAVVRETLRCRPVVPLTARRLAATTELGGRSWPAGTTLAPCIYLTNRRPDVYPDPEAFRPERFLGGAPDPYRWIPFGGGRRRCIGANFAMFEMKVVIRTVLERVVLEATDPAPEPIHRRNITLTPRHGTRVIAHPRPGLGAGRAA
ncbi:MAG TPA: cytochrome P450 [Gammaproteobacteria bacterium]|nr:cytochrome P450 [Gammaproteobacteria bacterium]